MKLLIAILMFAAPASAFAADEVALTSTVFVERVHTDAQGRQVTSLEPPELVTPGDHVVFRLDYHNASAAPADNFVVTNPIPSAVAYESADGEGAEVSVDGGRVWGQLSALRIAQPDGTSREAVPADVTHVRWAFARPIAVGATGRLSIRGIVK